MNQIVDKNIKDNLIVAQHNTLVEANYSANLTARALKVARLLISTINPNEKDLKRIEIDINSLKRFLGYKKGVVWGRFYDDLKDIAKRLNKEPIEINISEGKTLVTFFLVSYTIDLPNSNISFRISPDFIPYLLQLKKNYTSYLLTQIPKLKSSYSIRLYELLHQYRKFGKRKFEISNLQKKVGSNYQNKYNNFKRKVILQAQRDLKKHTDLAFIFNEIKTGRKVTHLEFIIFGNVPEEEKSSQLNFLDSLEINKQDEEKPAFSEKIIEALNQLGISEQNIAKYLAQGFDIINDEKLRKTVIKRCDSLETYYLEKLELLRNSPSAQSKENTAGFLVKALKEDWATTSKVKKQKAAKKISETKLARKTYEQLNRKVQALESNLKKLEPPIIVELVNDADKLEQAYNVMISAMTDSTKEFIRRQDGDVFSLSIKEQYEKSFSIKINLDIQLKELYPNLFSETEKMREEKRLAEKDADKLRKKYYF